MTISEKTYKDAKGKTIHDVRDEKAELVDETSPRLHAECVINLGNFESLRLSSHRSSEDREQASKEIIADMVALKKEFLRRHPELYS